MSNGHRVFTDRAGARAARHRLFLAVVLVAIASSGFLLGAIAGPVAADDVSGGGSVEAWVERRDDCVDAGIGADGAGGSADQPAGSGPAHHDVTMAGTGSTQGSVCGSDLEDIAQDILTAVPGGLDDVVPGGLDDVVPGGVGDVVPGGVGDVVPGGVDDVVPGGLGDVVPEGLGDVVPGDVDDAVPGDPGGRLSDGLGLAPELLSRLARVLPGLAGTDEPGGSPIVPSETVAPATGAATPSVVAGAGEAAVVPTDEILGGEAGRSPAPSGAAELIPAGATLPRTGGGLGAPLLRVLAFAAAGRGVFRLAGRRARDRS